MKFLLAMTFLLVATVVQAEEPPGVPSEDVPPSPVGQVTNTPAIEALTPTATATATPKPPLLAVTYEDQHRIYPGAVLKEVVVQHPGIAGKKVTVRFYAPDKAPLIRQYGTKTVYDYGWHKVEVKYHRGNIVVDYDGPSNRSIYVGVRFYLP